MNYETIKTINKQTQKLYKNEKKQFSKFIKTMQLCHTQNLNLDFNVLIRMIEEAAKTTDATLEALYDKIGELLNAMKVKHQNYCEALQLRLVFAIETPIKKEVVFSKVENLETRDINIMKEAIVKAFDSAIKKEYVLFKLDFQYLITDERLLHNIIRNHLTMEINEDGKFISNKDFLHFAFFLHPFSSKNLCFLENVLQDYKTSPFTLYVRNEHALNTYRNLTLDKVNSKINQMNIWEKINDFISDIERDKLIAANDHYKKEFQNIVRELNDFIETFKM